MENNIENNRLRLTRPICFDVGKMHGHIGASRDNAVITTAEAAEDVIDLISSSSDSDEDEEEDRNSAESSPKNKNKKRFKQCDANDLEELLAESTSESWNTKKATRFGMSLFKGWLLERNEETDFESKSPCELDQLLRFFYAEIRTKEGELYSKSSYLGIRAALQRYLQDPPNHRIINILRDKEFNGSNKVFVAMMRKLKKENKDTSCHYPPISTADMNKIRSRNAFDLSDPVQLQQKVWFDMTFHFASRGRESCRSLTSDSFVFKKDNLGHEFVEMADLEQTKAHKGSIDKQKSKPRMYGSSMETCPIKSLKVYLQKRNPGSDHFYQIPAKQMRGCCKFYNIRPMGINSLGNFMKRISKRLELSKIYTNHSIGATTVTTLAHAGLATKEIMKITGHKSQPSILSHNVESRDPQKRTYSTLLETTSSEVSGTSTVPKTKDLQRCLGFLIVQDLKQTQAVDTRSTFTPSESAAKLESNMSSKKFTLTKRLQGTEKNVWVDISKLAVENQALNLGQGFPDFMAPTAIVNCLKEVVNSSDKMMHQYARSFGLPRLVKALAKLYEPQLGRPVDPMKEVLVTVGAYGSLYCIIQGLINPGDEAIIIEPFFDCYQPMVTGAGGVPVFVPLRPSKEGSVTSSADWKLDPEELASKFNERTKLIIVNTPNNPLGKVFSREELTMIADLCKKHDVVCIADEVYEWMVYEGSKHIKMASLPGMWDRTVTIGSAGKTFSVTGWKTGWCVGPAHLVHCAMIVHQNCTYNCPTPIQEAVARGLELEMSLVGSPDSYLTSLAEELRPKRDFLAKQLQASGMKPVVPDGGYFMLADYTNMKADVPASEEAKDFRFVKWLTVNKKLTVIPPSAFYCNEHRHLAENFIRFCFIKEDATLEKACQILQEWEN